MTNNIRWHDSGIDREDRSAITGGTGCTIWLTGLSASGKSSIAYAAESVLVRSGRAAYTLDGDNVRHGLNAGLGFSAQSRAENVRRVGEVAKLMADAGLVIFAPLISPNEDGREAVRASHTAAGIPFHLVHVNTSLETCEERDPKGLYAMARRGEIVDFTGVSASYEDPGGPDLRIDTASVALDDAVVRVLGLIE